MSAIAWTEKTWNPIAGCSKVSPGCANCYAEVMAGRLAAMGQTKYQGLTVLQGSKQRWTGKIAFDEHALLEPLRRKKATTYFVNSMSDLFHESVTDEQLDRIYAVMALCQRHTFQVLTKRPARRRQYLSAENPRYTIRRIFDAAEKIDRTSYTFDCDIYKPLLNVWEGVSIENQETADARIPILQQTEAAIRFISAEPLLEHIDFTKHFWVGEEGGIEYSYTPRQMIDWVIVGGESGYGSRECNVQWIRSVVDQCRSANIPVFVKQLGMKPYVGKPRNRLKMMDRKNGGYMPDWPEDLRVRQMPLEEVSQ